MNHHQRKVLHAIFAHPLNTNLEMNAAGKVRDQLATQMTPDQIVEAQRLAREWKPTR
jgi:hypothetical protein